MSIAPISRESVHAVEATFGSGGGEPYAMALTRDHSQVLFLHKSRRGKLAGSAPLDVARWKSDADDADLSLLRSVTGPVLDIGCGPGRMVRAAMALGIAALGIDVSATAVEFATEAGLNVIRRSVFDLLPAEGHWQTALLVDGNIGIGGDVTVMLARCAELITHDGEIVVEVHPVSDWDRTYTGRLVDTHGRESAAFPWAEIGLEPLLERAAVLDLAPRQVWELGGRTFCRLATSLR